MTNPPPTNNTSTGLLSSKIHTSNFSNTSTTSVTSDDEIEVSGVSQIITETVSGIPSNSKEELPSWQNSDSKDDPAQYKSGCFSKIQKRRT